MSQEADLEAHRRHPYRAGGRAAEERAASASAAAWRRSGVATMLVLALVVVGAWLASIAWRERQLTHAVRALPRAVQEATFRRSYEELATTCATEPALAEHCSDEAQFILRFPQCGSDCERLARRYFPVVRK